MVLPRINLRKIWIFGFILITALLIFYIFQIGNITQTSFLISQHEKEVVLLSQQNKNLEFVISQTGSLASLEDILSSFNYEKVGKINYIQILDGTVLAK
ncbi:MAG: hypothetical protein HYW69_00335 [Candidatus Nealsonbacteria bacterium]|nr:hypothetical protein [Candidatus Nealsonbacteria bacterium]